MPPYITNDEDLAAVCAGMQAAAEASIAATSGA
jgi:hypothetical protein